MDVKDLEEAVKSSRSAMDEAVRELGDQCTITWDCVLCYMDACNALRMARGEAGKRSWLLIPFPGPRAQAAS